MKMADATCISYPDRFSHRRCVEEKSVKYSTWMGCKVATHKASSKKCTCKAGKCKNNEK